MEKFLKAWSKSSEIRNDNHASTDVNNNDNASIENSVQKQSSISGSVESLVTVESCNEVSTTSSYNRRFLSQWGVQFPWLHYNEDQRKAFCSVCTEAHNILKIKIGTGSINNERVYNTFVKDGFSNWKKAVERFKGHEHTMVHRNAVSSVSLIKSTNVSSMISNQLAKDRRDSRSCLIKIFESIRFLAAQGLPLRGNIEKNSNFIQLLHLRSIDQPLLKAWMERSKYKWTSHDIMNEILSLMSLYVQKKLLSEIKKSPFYAIMSDETTDCSRKEQMSINVRVVDEKLVVNETFLGFYDTPTTDADTLFKVINDALLRFDLTLRTCRGQCYDGARNVNGSITGLQTRIRKVEPQALYTHCEGHNLSLVAQDAMEEIPEVADFLSIIKELITFIRASSKRINIFNNIKSQFNEDEEEEEDRPVSLKPFCPTRWTVRVNSLKAVLDNYKYILEFCEIVAIEKTDSAPKARGFLTFLRKFETFLLLKISITTLEKVEALNETIQATSINFSSVLRRVEILKTNLNSSRSNEKFDEIWRTTSAAAKLYDLDEPQVPRRRTAPKRLDENSSSAYFPPTPEARYRVVYFGVIDQVLMSIDTRFDSETYKILSKMEEFALNDCDVDEIMDYLVIDEQCDFDIDRLVLHRQMLFDVLKHEKSCP